MPGGTLHERVKTGGPMPIGEAVDAILQVIAGLEAAHAAGILHRDIKPSNCFVEPGGTVKIGDFGLSISTLSRGDSALTMAGSVLGTPDFSSPEQLRGEPLDVRSDIYSVGGTLFHLLMGRPPFQAENVVALLATVLDKAPPSPRTLRPEIPEGLARVILRCLAKPAGERFKNYGELNRALLPFSSIAPTPATLGLRFVAGTVDHIIIQVVETTALMLYFGGFDALMNPMTVQTPRWVGVSIAFFALQVAYYAGSEGRWGATPGKALVGLRVGTLERNAPGLSRALLRALIYAVPSMISLSRYCVESGSWDSMAWNIGIGVTVWLYPALLCLTARRHNGFATVIDLVTKTRVIQRSAYEPRESVATAEEPVTPSETTPKIGPYHVLGRLGSGNLDALFLAYDTRLMRRVWIRQSALGDDGIAAGLRETSRPGRLRWLQGQRTEAESWDAYEAATGSPLTALAGEPRPWKAVRHWLFDLATEFAAASEDGSLPAQLSLDRVWITSNARAKWLDFPAPGAKDVAEALPAAEGLVFLNQVAISALEGRLASADEARTMAPGVPLPLPARDLLRRLRTADNFTAVAGALQMLIRQRPAVSRRRRFALVAGSTIPSLVVAAFMLLGIMSIVTSQRENPDVMRLKRALINHERIEAGRYPVQIDRTTGIDPLEIYIAGRFGPLIHNETLWKSPVRIEHDFGQGSRAGVANYG